MNKKFALITGASFGLGLEFAKLAAEKKYNLILVARRKNELNKIAESLEAFHNVKVHTIAKDLSLQNSANEIFREVKEELNADVELLINNAGFGSNGEFVSTNLNEEISQINVNIISLVSLTRLFLPEMKEKNRGIILNVASTAAYQPGPYMSVYYATKAFVKNFTLALRSELKGTNISVTLFSPGPTNTAFQDRAKIRGAIVANNSLMMNAETTAKIGFEAALKGKKEIIPGWKNKLGVLAAKLFPEFIITEAVKTFNKKRSK